LERGADVLDARGTDARAHERARRSRGAEVPAIADLRGYRAVVPEGAIDRQLGVQRRHVGAAHLHPGLVGLGAADLAEDLAAVAGRVGELEADGAGVVVDAVVAARADAQLGVDARE